MNRDALIAAAQKLLSVASALNPQVAIAAAGVEALSEVYSAVKETNKVMDQIMAETEATAPEVAKEVIQFYASKDADWERSRREHPGKDVT
jgi:hypothetical protein